MSNPSELHYTMGVVLLGMVISVSSLQAYIYFSNCSDSRLLRYLVGLVVLFDFTHQALITHSTYYYLITNFGKLDALGVVVWYVLQLIFSTAHRGTQLIHRSLIGLIAFCVQSFLTWRIWRLSHYNIWITGIVSVLVVAEFVIMTNTRLCCCYQLKELSFANVLCKAYGVIALVRVRTFEELAAELKGLSVTVNVLAAAGDVLIAATLAWLLQASKTGSQRLDTILNKLTIFVINTGVLTSLFAIGSLISILAAPNTFIYMSFFFCMGRLYTNTLLASLNARKKMQREDDNIQTTSCNILFQNGHLTKQSSFISFASKDYSKTRTFMSKPEEVYELGTTCIGNLSQVVGIGLA
ncbi:hypothetical protein C8R42DRAFT_643065 [Lentinula raphanica]|nr:hypothetical protein C8R42DRAFT_643065 [Lentinula raphanica]